jgi:hypothetical protein
MLLAVALAACQIEGQMSNSDPIVASPELAAVLVEFEPFLLSDDVERTDKLASTDSATLRKLAEAVEPLFDEINATLDKTGAASSLTDEEQDLESNLHSLAQAAIEARMTLEERGE